MITRTFSKTNSSNSTHYIVLHPQSGDRIVTIGSVTSLHPMYQTWNWVTRSSFWPSVTQVFFKVFEKKAQDIYFCENPSNPSKKYWRLINDLQNFTFQKHANAKQRWKLANLLRTANVCLQHKSTLGVHYRTRSPSRWIPWSQHVTQFHVCYV